MVVLNWRLRSECKEDSVLKGTTWCFHLLAATRNRPNMYASKSPVTSKFNVYEDNTKECLHSLQTYWQSTKRQKRWNKSITLRWTRLLKFIFVGRVAFIWRLFFGRLFEFFCDVDELFYLTDIYYEQGFQDFNIRVLFWSYFLHLIIRGKWHENEWIKNPPQKGGREKHSTRVRKTVKIISNKRE